VPILAGPAAVAVLPDDPRGVIRLSVSIPRSTKRLLLVGIDYPVLAGILIVLLTVFFALQIPRLEIDISADGLMVENDPARPHYERFKQAFGDRVRTIVLVKADDVLAPSVLQLIRRLSDALERIVGVTRVESLTTVRNIKGDGDSLNTDPLVGDEIPTAGAELHRIRADALRNRLFIGAIVRQDASVAAINVSTEALRADQQFNRRFSGQVEALIARESAPGLTLYQVGDPLLRATARRYVWRDLLILVPISIAVLLGALLFVFRMVQGAVIPLATEAVSIVWTLGLMGLVGLPINILTATIPSLLITIGFSEDVHMLTRYYGQLEAGADRPSAIRTMMQHTAFPVLVTTLTTAVGFASLITTDITMLRQLGYAASLGITADFVVTVIALPIMLASSPVPRRLRTAASASKPTGGLPERTAERLAEFSFRHRPLVAILAALLVTGSLVGWYFLRVDNDFVGSVRERSFLRQRVQDLNASLGGAISLSIVIETERADGIKDPDLLKKIAGLQDFLGAAGGVAKTVSVVDYLRTMHREMNGGDPRLEVVPDSPELVAQYLLTLEGDELAEYVDFTAATAHVAIRHNLTSSWELSALLKRLDEYLARTFAPPVTVRYTGENVLLATGDHYLVVNEITSLVSSFALIGLIQAWLFRSFRAGLLSLIPNIIPAFSVFGLMGLFDVPLTVGTAPIASVALGIAVDDTTHFLMTYRDELREGRDRRTAILNTLRLQGRPIIYVSLVLAAGFGVLVFSNFTPVVYFGIFSALVMLVAMVCELLLTPALLYSVRLSRRGGPR
jgi:hypothetical protein